ncbi:helix-turn-helix domain-containing protein [Streptomyces sp. NPDC059991]|uniref:helix-turn-helix domain-containing protein n=1 Tax=Streptomyces sp. NPDC059991 TaxID=3347028 RepID=UPI0036755D1D
MQGQAPSERAALRRAEAHPTALKVILGGRLRRLREAAGLEESDLTKQLGFKPSKISRIEKGRQGCSELDARAMLGLYGVSDVEEVEEFVRLVDLSHQPDWWKSWRDVVSKFFSPLLSLEGAAEVIRIYEPVYVPGQLQTAEYARAVIRAEWPTRSAHEIDRMVALRQARQHQLEQPGAPVLWAVIKMDALLWSVSDPDIRAAQIRHLIGWAQRPNVKIQVAPVDVFRTVPASTNMTHLSFAVPDLDNAVYSEHLVGSMFTQDPREVEHYLTLLDRLAAQVLTRDESLAYLQNLAAGR